MRRLGAVLLALAVLVGLTADRGPLVDPASALLATLDRVALDLLRQSPEAITTRGLSQSLGVRNDALDSLAIDATGESYAPLRNALAEIGGVDLRREEPRTRWAVEAFTWWLRQALDSRPYQDDACLVSTYMTSVPQHIAWFMTHIHPLQTPEDAADYSSRLSQIPDRFAELVVRLTASEAKGALAPRFLLVRAADELEAIGRRQSGESEFFTRFASAVEDMPGLDPDVRTTLLADAIGTVTDVVLPAYVQLAATVRDFASRATDDIGVWRLCDGDAYYAYLLQAYTTTGMAADEIYGLGIREVARLQAEIRAAAADLGYNASAPLVELFARIRRDSGIVSGEDVVRECRSLIDEVAALARPAFVDWPEAPLAVEAGENIAYFAEGTADGARPGVFFAPVEQARPAYSLRSLVAHETIPGHFLQTATARQSGLPAFLGGVAFSSYTEGWAVYAERLMGELGAYAEDPYGNIGRLQEELFRAARLVVDPGIHAKRWTYEQAVAYMIEATGLDAATVRDEVERYIVAPGQAAAYSIGLYKLLELRDRARSKLGAAFDLAEFHDAVLSCGSVPIPVLEQVVDEFIESRRPASKEGS